jgi:hypothetical protein
MSFFSVRMRVKMNSFFTLMSKMRTVCQKFAGIIKGQWSRVNPSGLQMNFFYSLHFAVYKKPPKEERKKLPKVKQHNLFQECAVERFVPGEKDSQIETLVKHIVLEGTDQTMFFVRRKENQGKLL